MPLTILGDVGLWTGSVRHDGGVRISGCVQSGYLVEATGDILVVGDLRGGQLVSGGDITVRGIVSGPDALVDALGRVRLRQASDARVLAGGDLLIDTAAERCDLSSGGRIRLPGRPGALLGGRARAATWVEATRVACSGGRPAEITVGGAPFDDGREQVALRLEFARKQANAAARGETESVVDYRRRISTMRAYRHLRTALERRLAQIEQAESARAVPCVTVHGESATEAVIRLGDAPGALRLNRADAAGPFTAVLEDGEIDVRRRKESTGVG